MHLTKQQEMIQVLRPLSSAIWKTWMKLLAPGFILTHGHLGNNNWMEELSDYNKEIFKIDKQAEKQNSNICSKMNEPEKYCAEWNKPGTERLIMQDSSQMKHKIAKSLFLSPFLSHSFSLSFTFHIQTQRERERATVHRPSWCQGGREPQSHSMARAGRLQGYRWPWPWLEKEIIHCERALLWWLAWGWGSWSALNRTQVWLQITVTSNDCHF